MVGLVDGDVAVLAVLIVSSLLKFANDLPSSVVAHHMPCVLMVKLDLNDVVLTERAHAHSFGIVARLGVVTTSLALFPRAVILKLRNIRF